MTDTATAVDGELVITDLLIAYEMGGLSDEAAIALFQHLVETGLAWQLQGHYGRLATALIEQGLVRTAGEY